MDINKKKKVTVFIGTDAKQATYKVVLEFKKYLKELGDIDFEYVFLKDYHLEYCHSCLNCFMKGEEFCPSKDDRDRLLKKIDSSDGIIFATPNYVLQVSARMKNFIDRMAFIFHRPRYFDKAFTGIVSQGVFGGKGVLKYLHTTGKFMGFHVSKGCNVTTLRPITKNQQQKLNKKVKKASIRFYKELLRKNIPPSPSFFKLILFRMARTGIKTLDPKFKDYQYYKEKGWLTSDYYYPIRLNPLKKLVGKISDILGKQIMKDQ